MELVAQSDFLVLPSRALEGFPMVLVEAFSVGTPSIVPNHGAFPQLVIDGRGGILFEPRNVDSLTRALTKALRVSQTEWRQMSEICVRNFREFYTEESNYRILLEIYETAVRGKRVDGASRLFPNSDKRGLAD